MSGQHPAHGRPKPGGAASGGSSTYSSGVGASRYRDAQVGGCIEVVVETRADGSTLVRSTQALQPFPLRITDRLEHWSQQAPDRTFVARRDGGRS